MKIINKMKNKIVVLLIVAMVFNLAIVSYATGTENGTTNTENATNNSGSNNTNGNNDVNVDGTDVIQKTSDGSWMNNLKDEEIILGWDDIARAGDPGARITLYDIESQNIIKTLDFINKEYGIEKAKELRRISNYSTYAFTCAEAGLLAQKGYVFAGTLTLKEWKEAPFEKTIIARNGEVCGEYVFQYLPYSTYKEWEGYVKLIPPCDITGPIKYWAGYDYMIDRLGCFEITATQSEIATPCTVKFHPNGKFFGLESEIDEKYTIKDVKLDSEVKLIKT